MGEQLYPKTKPKMSNRDQTFPNRRWVVEYDLMYDGGSSKWHGYYKAKWHAKMDAWYHVHVASWGGTAILMDRNNL
jgi:hypothetical protein